MEQVARHAVSSSAGSVRPRNFNRKEPVTMREGQLETMADAILEGKLSVSAAEEMLGGKVVHSPTITPTVDATPAQKAHVRVTRAAAADSYLRNKHVIRVNPTGDADDINVERFGGTRLWPDQATEGTFVNFLPKIAEEVLRDQAPRTFDDDEVTADVRDKWNVLEVARLRWPVVAFRPTYRDPSGTRKPLAGDDRHGYIADPTWREGKSRLDAELRRPHVRVTKDWQRDSDGCILLNRDGSRMEQVEESVVMGAVEWEYRRRSQGRQPWMSRKTFRFVNDVQRYFELREYQPWLEAPGTRSFETINAAQRRLDAKYRADARVAAATAKAKADRSALIQLIRECGGDPKAPEVVKWVRSVGITTALEKLHDRQAARV